MIRSILLLLGVTLALNAPAQDRAQQLDSLFTSLHSKQGFNGNVLVAEKGKVLYKKSFGMADESTQTPLNENSVFELASCSKQFTAMGVAILNKQMKLQYDDPISKLIPELSLYKGVTIRHLLNHTAGLPDYMELFDSLWDKSRIATNDDIVKLFKQHEPAARFEPNSKFEYSNTGYALLATIIERASGMEYGDFLKMHIFTPLKMNHTFVYTRRYKSMTVANYAYGYVKDAGGKKVLPDNSADHNYVIYLDGIKGDGTVNSTVNDLLLWDRALYGTALLDKEQMKEIFASAILSNQKKSQYAFGWMVDNKKDFGNIATHSGGWPGYVTYIERHTDNDKTIIILQNTEETSIPGRPVRNILYGKPIDEPVVKHTEIKLPPAKLEKYVGKYALSPDFVLTITKEGDQMKAQATGQGKLDIYAEAEDKFFLKAVNAQIEFLRNEKGAVNKLVLHQGGRDMEGERLPDKDTK